MTNTINSPVDLPHLSVLLGRENLQAGFDTYGEDLFHTLCLRRAEPESAAFLRRLDDYCRIASNLLDSHRLKRLQDRFRAEFDQAVSEVLFAARAVEAHLDVTFEPCGDEGPDLHIAKNAGAAYVEVTRVALAKDLDDLTSLVGQVRNRLQEVKGAVRCYISDCGLPFEDLGGFARDVAATVLAFNRGQWTSPARAFFGTDRGRTIIEDYKYSPPVTSEEKQQRAQLKRASVAWVEMRRDDRVRGDIRVSGGGATVFPSAVSVRNAITRKLKKKQLPRDAPGVLAFDISACQDDVASVASILFGVPELVHEFDDSVTFTGRYSQPERSVEVSDRYPAGVRQDGPLFLSRSSDRLSAVWVASWRPIDTATPMFWLLPSSRKPHHELPDGMGGQLGELIEAEGWYERNLPPQVRR